VKDSPEGPQHRREQPLQLQEPCVIDVVARRDASGEFRGVRIIERAPALFEPLRVIQTADERLGRERDQDLSEGMGADWSPGLLQLVSALPAGAPRPSPTCRRSPTKVIPPHSRSRCRGRVSTRPRPLCSCTAGRRHDARPRSRSHAVGQRAAPRSGRSARRECSGGVVDESPRFTRS
jgi:hypothetical protein